MQTQDEGEIKSFGQVFQYYLLSLKPVDRLVLSYLCITFPFLFIADNPRSVIWFGVILRILIIPIIVYLRHYLATNPRSKIDHKWRFSFYFRQLKLCFQLPIILTCIMDLYPIVLCIYCYSEDGAIISNIWSRDYDFLDLDIQEYEAWLFDIDPEKGLGEFLRSKTSYSFNRGFGEYLHFCYFFFYFVLIGTYLLTWLCCPRESFDRLSSAECGVYLLSLVYYLFSPVAGPFWTYTPPNPSDVGYFFSYITHEIVSKGSSTGTAFPSSHCGITVAVWICACMYMPRIGALYLFICPGIIYATMWCGFHYFVDTFLGVTLGIFVTVAAIQLCNHCDYRPPFADTHNYNVKPGSKRPQPIIFKRGSQTDPIPIYEHMDLVL
eukprot:Awhi_evm1s15730